MLRCLKPSLGSFSFLLCAESIEVIRKALTSKDVASQGPWKETVCKSTLLSEGQHFGMGTECLAES